MQNMYHISNKFSDHNLRHIRLYTHADLGQGTPWILDDLANLNRLQIAHQQIISSLSNFPSLTALDLENCFSLVSEDVVSQYICHLPSLVRFRAHESALKPNFDLTQGSRLDESLASRTRLKQLSMKNLGYVSPAWCYLNWQGPLESLTMRGCGNLEDRALLRFIRNIPTLEKIHLQDHHFRSLEISTEMPGIPFPNLKRFTFLGDSLENHLFDILAQAPLLEKVHLHSTPVRDCLRGMRHSISISHDLWSSLRKVVLSFIRRNDEERAWLQRWGDDRNVELKFYFGSSTLNIGDDNLSSDEETGNETAAQDGSNADDAIEAEFVLSSDPETGNQTVAQDDHHADDASEAESEQSSDESEAEFEPSEDSDISKTEDWEFDWRSQSL